MLLKSLFPSILAATSFVSSVAAEDLPAIEIVGNKFFYSNNGSQFYIKGIAYQQNNLDSNESFVDPLANPEHCKRDIPYLEAVDTNVIRVYALDTSQDHTECMQMLQDAGIYVIADLSQPDESINRDDPSWDLDLFERYTSVVDLFHNYTNILGFFAGNEVTNKKSNTDASAFVKAAIRDTKAYIKSKGYRSIPVGYSANDDSAIRVSLADYFACGDEDEAADFFGINMYEWCGDSSYKASGYESATNDYKNLGIPIFFSEYGCNEVRPRKFTEVATLFGDQMTPVWSGGIVYMYFEEENNYGLVSIKDNTVSTLKDYSYYSSEIKDIHPSSAKASAESASSISRTTCPTNTNNWEASTNLPPTPDKEVCECMSASLKCVVDDKVDSDDYSDLFSYICAKIDCDGINANGTTGEYGAYSPCHSKDKLSFVMNLYYEQNKESKSACDFGGSASLQSAKTASSCSAYLSSAGSSGLGTVSGTVRTDTSQSTSDSGSGSSSSSSSGSSGSKSAASIVSVNLLTKIATIGISIVVGFGLITM